jgi:hypothetical protein
MADMFPWLTDKGKKRMGIAYATDSDRRYSSGSSSSGSSSSGSSSSDALLAFQQQQAAQAARAARAARRQEMINQQKEAGFASAQQGEALARQQLGQFGMQQQAADKEALTRAQQAQGAAGSQAVAGGAQPQTQAQKLNSMGIGGAGAIAGLRDVYGGQVAANLGAGGTGQPSNTFQLPSIFNLTFGGS